MNKKRIIAIIVLIIIIVCIGILLVKFRNHKKIDVKTEKKVEIADQTKGFDYILEKRDTKLFKSKFEELKKVLESSEIDYKKYAELLSELYIIDLYTISNKDNQYDVGATEFVLESARENFILKVKDTIYKYIEDNTNGKRTQELPTVSDVKVGEIKEEKFKIADKEYDAYVVPITWEYEKELKYDKKATITLVKVDKYLYVAKQGQ